MERDPQGGSDVGLDYERDLGDEVGTAIRDTAPDYLAPIDADAPVSGHQPAPEASASPADAPEGPSPPRPPPGGAGGGSRSKPSPGGAGPPTGRRVPPSRSSTRARPGCR